MRNAPLVLSQSLECFLVLLIYFLESGKEFFSIRHFSFPILGQKFFLSSAAGGIRTHTLRVLSALPLPVGLQRHYDQPHTERITVRLLPCWSVGKEGFEPSTSCSQSKRSTRLSHFPKSSLSIIHPFNHLSSFLRNFS